MDTPTDLKLIAQGAEGRLFECMFQGKPCIVKERFSKKYRHPTLDEKLTKERLSAESKAINKAAKIGVPAPVIYHVDLPSSKIYMERINGVTAKWYLDTEGENRDGLAWKIGACIAKLHDAGVVHGDLTTSNIMVRMPVEGAGSAAAGAAGGAASSSSASVTTSTEAGAPAALAPSGRSIAAEEASHGHGSAAVHSDLGGVAPTLAEALLSSPAPPAAAHAAMAEEEGGKNELPAKAEAVQEKEAKEEAMLEEGAAAAAGGAAAGEATAEAEAEQPAGNKKLSGTAKQKAAKAAIAARANSATTAAAQLPPPPPFTKDIVFIDFGLAMQNAGTEDKGVDLYVLERAILSAHPEFAEQFFSVVYRGYLANLKGKDASVVPSKYEQVRARGRKRLAFG